MANRVEDDLTPDYNSDSSSESGLRGMEESDSFKHDMSYKQAWDNYGNIIFKTNNLIQWYILCSWHVSFWVQVSQMLLNTIFEFITGYKAEEILGRNW